MKRTAKKPAEIRVAAPGRLRSLLLDGTDPVVLLGAGASKGVRPGGPRARPTTVAPGKNQSRLT